MAAASDKTLQLISDIYKVGLSPSHWPDVMDRLAGHFGAMGCAIFYEDSRHPELETEISVVSEFWCIDEHAVRYWEHVRGDEPSARLMRKAQPGEIVTGENLPLMEKLRIAPYAAKMWQLFGIRAVVAARLNSELHWFDYITFQFDGEHGPMRPSELDELRLLLPHVARALEISRPIALLERRFHAVLDALDHVHIGVLVVTAQRSVVIANQEARRILEADDGLSVDANGLLAASSIAADAQIQQLLEEVSDTSEARGTSSGRTLPIGRRSGRDPYLLQLVPLRDGEGLVAQGFRGAMAFCIDPDTQTNISTQGLQLVYGLTDAETAVCRLVIDGLTNAEIADSRGVSLETVKSQVQVALKKTRAENRSQLVRLALSLNLPVDHGEG